MVDYHRPDQVRVSVVQRERGFAASSYPIARCGARTYVCMYVLRAGRCVARSEGKAIILRRSQEQMARVLVEVPSSHEEVYVLWRLVFAFHTSVGSRVRVRPEACFLVVFFLFCFWHEGDGGGAPLRRDGVVGKGRKSREKV